MVRQADVNTPPHARTTPLEHLDLTEVLDFRPDRGIIRLHEQRVVILSAAAMGLLRKELIDTLGGGGRATQMAPPSVHGGGSLAGNESASASSTAWSSFTPGSLVSTVLGLLALCGDAVGVSP